MATGQDGSRKSSSMFWRTTESESRESTRLYWVWLKASSLVKDSAQVATTITGQYTTIFQVLLPQNRGTGIRGKTHYHPPDETGS